MYGKILFVLIIFVIAGASAGLYIHFKKPETLPPTAVTKAFDERQIVTGQELQKKMIEREGVFLTESRYRVIIATYEGMLKKSSDNAMIKKLLAETYLKLGNYQLKQGKEADAEKSFVRAKELQ